MWAPAIVDELRRRVGMDNVMGPLSIGLLGYLILALLKPEKFEMTLTAGCRFSSFCSPSFW